MLFSVEQAFVGREEIRAPLKTPAWEARSASGTFFGFLRQKQARGRDTARGDTTRVKLLSLEGIFEVAFT